MTAPTPPVALPGWVDPVCVFAGFEAQHADLFWLDAGSDATQGWSFIGAGTPVDDDEVRNVLCGRHRTRGEQPTPAPAGRLIDGWVGWVGYEQWAARAGAPTSPAEPGIPQTMWLRTAHLIAFDHAARRVWVAAAGGDAKAADFAALAQQVAGWGAVPAPQPGALPERTATARESPEAYAASIESCRDAIREGDAYQLCLTTRFTVGGVVDAAATYLSLRTDSPTHHGGFIRNGAVALLSASPERVLEVSDGLVRTRPIKGTRPRGMDAASDAALIEELRSSAKERAENVMIVDLMRNDLSRVCEPGTVSVEGLLEVESYRAVHQLVSSVAGTVSPGMRVGDLLDACFPAGSMTGVPKLSAMTILHRLERAPRGVFSGAFGWVGTGGDLDLAMVIRSIVVHPGGAYVGAGGGITWGSEPEAEVAEVGVKARAPLAALGAALPPGW